MRIRLWALLIVALAVWPLGPAAGAQPVRAPVGPILLARSGDDALYLWDASSDVAQLVREKTLGDDDLHALEATACLALTDRAVTSHAKTMAIRVLYSRDGSVSPVYGTPTLAGVESVFTLGASRAELQKHGNSWAQQLRDGRVPKELRLQVSGKLPPPQ